MPTEFSKYIFAVKTVYEDILPLLQSTLGVEEVNKQVEKIANAKEKLDVLDEFEPEKGTQL